MLFVWAEDAAIVLNEALRHIWHTTNLKYIQLALYERHIPSKGLWDISLGPENMGFQHHTW